MVQLDLWEGMSPVVLTYVHYIVVVLNDHTSFIYMDSRLWIVLTCVSAKKYKLISDCAAAVTPSGYRLTVGLQVQVGSVPRKFIHHIFEIIPCLCIIEIVYIFFPFIIFY